REMLSAAGLEFEAMASGVDERAARAAMAATGDSIDAVSIAQQLAGAKAEAVSRAHPDALVIGGDQVLALGKEVFEKPSGIEAARKSLMRLRGREHALHSAVTLAEKGRVVWRHVQSARLVMRPFSDAFLDDYLAMVGPRVLGVVGAYELEGRGVQLFERIEGDYFTILGMPLLALVEQLRRREVIAA
ncbi:MAG: Maf family protein, partial [Hyphomicrobium sp.]